MDWKTIVKVVIIMTAIGSVFRATQDIEQVQIDLGAVEADIVEIQDIVLPSDALGWSAVTTAFAPYEAMSDDPTYVIYYDGDVSSNFSEGMRVRLKQGGAFKYFLITDVDSSSMYTGIYLYGGTDYDLTTDAITDLAVSPQKAPVGFPVSPDKWTVLVSSTDMVVQNSPVQGTWYSTGVQITIPIGVWNVSHFSYGYAVKTGSTGADVTIAMSSSTDFSSYVMSVATIGYYQQGVSMYRSGVFTLDAETTYYFGFLTGNLSLDTIWANIIEVRAVSAYL